MSLCFSPEELLVQRLNSGSYRVCDKDQNKSLTTQEAFSCSEAYFRSIGREAIPIYKEGSSNKDLTTGGLAGDLNGDGEYTRKEWELVNHTLTWKITKAMLSIILDCDVAEITESTMLKGTGLSQSAKITSGRILRGE
ncbi:Oidioi.mRNA.OKI2018_I69.chr1.g2640.t1.cds [Oikopleura dioica]|uniref:Oidioi.mRNA.OKI2018_I69.chr1.g2640.t1.cds n=1 Tax=Oikopleura dioica TaxID=34765 RepID=A0ABN7SVL6_OIKDI|nr:Oidioi.mRNA.OKI2018_I69.chr1.g2640.t1.cds [Oikopleura dioica]